MSNIKDAISKVTGIAKPELDKIVVEVKANQAALGSCSRHDFSIVLDRHTKKPIENPMPAQQFGAKFKCSKCGGIVDNLTRIWYERGLKHSESGWTKMLPTESGSYWWWNGDEDAAPIHIEIMWGCHSQSCFAPMGQYGWNRAQDVSEMRGWWKSLTVPDPPSQETTSPSSPTATTYENP